MRRPVIAVLSMVVIVAGALGLPARVASAQGAAIVAYCCVSGNGFECCGTSYCSSNETSCTGVDKDE
jgi:hypothetical protein